MLEAAKAIITLKLEDTDFYKQLSAAADETRKELRSLGVVATAVGATITASIGLAVAKVTSEAKQMRSVEAVLKDCTGRAQELARAIGDEVGRSVKSVTKDMANFALASAGLKLTKDQTVDMAAAMTALGADIDEAFGERAGAGFQAVQSAILGNNEALARYGIVLNDAAIAAQLLAMGIEGGTEAATAQQTAIARQNAIMQQAVDSGLAGEAASNAYAVAQSRLSQSFGNLTNAIGKAAKPGYDFVYNVLAGMMDYLSAAIDWTTKFVAENEAVVSVISNVAGALTACGGVLVAVTGSIATFVGGLIAAAAKSVIFTSILRAIPVIGPIVGKVMMGLRVAMLAVAGVGAVTVGTFAAVAAAIAAVGYGVYKLQQATGILNPVLKALGNVGEWLTGIWNSLADSIGGVVGWLMKLVGIGGGGSSGEDPAKKEQVGPDGAKLTEEQQKETFVPEELKAFAEQQKESLKTPQQKFDEYIAKLSEMYDAELIDLDQMAALAAKARQERDDALRQEYEQSDAGKKAKELQEFGDRLREETMTLEEQVAAKIAKIQEALASDPTLKEAAERAIAAANKELEDAKADAQKKAEDEANRVRDEQQKAIREKFGLRSDIAKAQGGEWAAGAMLEVQKQLIEELRAKGFNKEADAEEIDYQGKIVERSQATIEEMEKITKPREIFSTRSAQEAMYGLSSNSLSQQQLDELKEAKELQREARDRLDDIKKALED